MDRIAKWVYCNGKEKDMKKKVLNREEKELCNHNLFIMIVEMPITNGTRENKVGKGIGMDGQKAIGKNDFIRRFM